MTNERMTNEHLTDEHLTNEHMAGRSRTIEAGGLPTHYLEAGAARPGQDPLILLHGGGAGADGPGNWGSTISTFARHFHVIAPDMVGFGATAKPDPAGFEYSQPARVKHLRDLLRALKIPRAAFIGNSMGGCTALGLAVEAPECVSRLVLMGSAGLTTTLHADLMPVINYDFTRDGMVRLMRALTHPRFEIDPALVDYRHRRSLDPACRAAYGATMGWIKAQGGLFYPEACIARVACPTLVVNGKDDKVVPLANAYRFLELIDDSWGYILPHCGHWAMMERPDAFSRVCLDFLERR
ncbi:MAG TPA: alpha/beta hydrolase [Burkholderiaceae bacterium]|mgnify:CR=1 FL=1|nr:alpha/beta hydrolase [Burkholderiaceae bacterium]